MANLELSAGLIIFEHMNCSLSLYVAGLVYYDINKKLSRSICEVKGNMSI